jgi:hypothetical protein
MQAPRSGGARAPRRRLARTCFGPTPIAHYNGYLEIWLQRVTQPKAVGIQCESQEPICNIVNGETLGLWENAWIANDALKGALSTSKIVLAPVEEANEVVQPEEVRLFKENAWAY